MSLFNLEERKNIIPIDKLLAQKNEIFEYIQSKFDVFNKVEYYIFKSFWKKYDELTKEERRIVYNDLDGVATVYQISREQLDRIIMFEQYGKYRAINMYYRKY